MKTMKGSTMLRTIVAAGLAVGLLAPTIARAAQARSSERSENQSRFLKERCRQEVDRQHPAGTLSKRRNERAILIQTCVDKAGPN
jgi:hypothetical protein